MTVKEIRKITGLTQKDFGKRYGIPKRNLENWENGVVACKGYILDLLEFRVMADVKAGEFGKLEEKKGQE